MAINGDQVGQQITVRVRRNGQEQTFQVTLGDRPAQAPTP
jgi:S1-C subfamily serine protease